MAEDLGSINIRIEPDLTGFKRELERETDRIDLDLGISFSRTEIKKSLEAIEKTLDDVDVGLDIDRREFQRDLSKTLKSAQAAAEDIDVGLEVSKAAQSSFRSRVQGLVASVQATTRDIKVGVDVRQAEAALAGLTAGAGRAVGSLARLTAIGGAVGAGVAVGGVALGVNSLREFDAALNQSLAIVADVTPEIREQFKSTAETIAQTTVFSAAEAGEAYFFLASAGLDVEQQLAALPKVAEFAQAGMFDLATATDIATDAQSALGLSADDAQENLNNLVRVNDVLVKANLLANASVEQFGTALTNKAGAAARNTGRDLEEVTAVLAAFADQGVKSRLAGERVGILFERLGSTAQNNADAFAEAGIQVFDSAGQFRNIADVIADVENSLEGLSDADRTAALENLGLSEQLAQTVNALTGSSSKIRQFEQDLRGAGGTAAQVAEAQLGSLDAQLSLIGSNIDLVLQSLGQPVADRLKEVFAGGQSEFQEFFASARTQAEAFGQVLLVQFDRILAFVTSADFATFLGSLKDGFETIAAGVQEAGAAFSDAFSGDDGESQSFIVSLGQAFEGFAGILADVLPFVATISGRIAGLIANNQELVGTFAKFAIVGTILGGIARIGGFLLKSFRFLLPVFKNIGFFIADIFITLGRWVPLLARIGFTLGRFATPVGIVSTILFELIRRSETFREVLKTIGGVILKFALAPMNLLIDAVEWVINNLEGLKDAAKDALGEVGLFGVSINDAAGVAGGALDAVSSGFGLLGDSSEETAERASLSFSGIEDAAIGVFDSLGVNAEAAAVRVSAAFGGISAAAQGIVADTQQALADANIDEAVAANISDAQVEALQKNKRVAEASAADINAAFKRIGAVAVSTGFRRSLQKSLDGLLGQVRFLRERSNIQFQQIGQVNVGQLFADSFQAGIDRVVAGTVRFVELEIALFRTLRAAINLQVSGAMATMVGILRSGFRRGRGVTGAGLRAIEDVLKGFIPVFRDAGDNLIAGLLDGMIDEWVSVEDWLRQRADRIRELKGPLPYDRTILFDAGRAVISGFQSGLESAWNPVENWLSTRGQLMKGIVPVNDVLSLSSEILLGNVANPAEALTDLEPDLPRFWTSFGDMVAQAREIARLFNVQITSTFRDIATNIGVGGAPGSLHTQGRAVDFSGSNSAMDALAEWAEQFSKFFQEILWQVAGHFDHVHLGWAFPAREKGGPTKKGQTYLVGERGPELWTAPARGHVYNHKETAAIQQAGSGSGGYNPQYHVHANGVSAETVLALLQMRERKARQRINI